MIRAVVFDFDGVIANSEPLHFQAFRRILEEDGLTLTQDDYYSRYLGFDDAGVFRAVSRASGGVWDADRIASLVARKAVVLEALEHDGSILFPGADAAVRRMAAEVPLAIASGALKAEIARVLDRAGLAAYLRVVVGAEDTPASKPAPDPYLKAVAELGQMIGSRLAGPDCVAIEDSVWGLDSARAAGLRTIGVTHTYPATSLSVADLVLDHLDALTMETLRRPGW